MPVLVDSSLWVHQRRKCGDPAKRDRVNALLENGEAAWGAPVRLELWRGVTNDAERRTRRRYEALRPEYAISPEVWSRSIGLADRGRASGGTVPLSDLVIYTYGHRNLQGFTWHPDTREMWATEIGPMG